MGTRAPATFAFALLSFFNDHGISSWTLGTYIYLHFHWADSDLSTVLYNTTIHLRIPHYFMMQFHAVLSCNRFRSFPRNHGREGHTHGQSQTLRIHHGVVQLRS